MKTNGLFSPTRWVILLSVTITLVACSKHMDNTPVPPRTMAQILVEAGTWNTTGATLIKADSTTVTLASNDPFIKTLLLYNVTFYSNGTAIDTNNPDNLTINGMTWHLNGTHLRVNLNANNEDKVDAVITYLNDNKLILKVSDFYFYNGVDYVGLIQTFGH